MKELSCLVLFAFALTISAFGQKSIPSVEVKSLDRETFNLQKYASNPDKVYIIDFWATWCSPCKKELDAIADYYEDWQADYNVELIAITIDNARALPKVPGIVETKGWEYTIFSGNEEAMRNAFNFQTIPQTVVAKGGKIVYEHNGYVPGDEEELEQIIMKAAKGE